MTDRSHPPGAVDLNNAVKHQIASHDQGKPVIGKNYDQPFRGLPAEVRLMIWRYVLPTKVRLRRSDFETRWCDSNRFTRTLKTGAPLGLELLIVSKTVREEFMSIAIGRILLDTSVFTHGSLRSAWKAVPKTIRCLLRGLEGCIFGLARISNCLRLCEISISLCAASASHVSELRLIVDGLVWDNLAKQSCLRDYEGFEWEDYIETFDIDSADQAVFNERGFEQEDLWDCLGDEDWDLYYEKVLPLSTRYGYTHDAKQLFESIKEGKISKCIILFRNLNEPQKWIMETLDNIYQEYLISAKYHEVKGDTCWIGGRAQTYANQRYSGSITFERC